MRKFVKGASTAKMLEAFQSKLSELNSSCAVEGATAADLVDALEAKIDELEGVESTTAVEAADDVAKHEPFMLIDYSPDNGENGMEADEFYPLGKFFAENIDDAQAQLEAAKVNLADRMQYIPNAYVSEFNPYFDDGSEVYQDLETLIIREIRSPEEIAADPGEIDEYGNPVFTCTDVTASDNLYNAAWSFDADEAKMDEEYDNLWSLKSLNPEISAAIDEFDARYHGEFEPLRFVLEVGYQLDPDDYTGVAPFTVYITNPNIKPDSDLGRDLAIPGSIEIYDEEVNSCQSINADIDLDASDPMSEVNEDSDNWEQIDVKSITDYDGFSTDYSLWKNIVTDHYACVYGDIEIYSPWEGDWDADFDTLDQAREWFDNYRGADEDDLY